MASAELSRRVGQDVAYPPLSEMSDPQRREFHEALLEAKSFEDLPGKWPAAILEAEQNRPKLRVVSGESDSATVAEGGVGLLLSGESSSSRWQPRAPHMRRKTVLSGHRGTPPLYPPSCSVGSETSRPTTQGRSRLEALSRRPR